MPGASASTSIGPKFGTAAGVLSGSRTRGQPQPGRAVQGGCSPPLEPRKARNALGSLNVEWVLHSSTGDHAMAEKDLKALFVHQLKDTYFAENAILKALPQMAEAAQSEELRGALAIHLRETEGQVKRLEQVFQIVGERPEGVECKAIQGIIEEGQEILQEFQGGEASDAGLIAAAQAVEHYEITRYGTLLAWAKQFGLSEAEGLIQETLIEEENTDELLSDLAEDAINPAAAA